MSSDQTYQPVSGWRRVLRGWLTVVVGIGALAAPLLIGQWGVLFLFAAAPMGVFIIGVGVIEIMRGTAQLEREPR